MNFYICVKHTYYQCLIIKISHPTIVVLVSVCERAKYSMQLSWRVQEQHAQRSTEMRIYRRECGHLFTQATMVMGPVQKKGSGKARIVWEVYKAL